MVSLSPMWCMMEQETGKASKAGKKKKKDPNLHVAASMMSLCWSTLRSQPWV